MNRKSIVIAGAAVAGVFALIFVSLLVWTLASWSSIKNDGVAYENQLVATDKKVQNNLSAFRQGFYEQFSVVDAKKKALDEILTNAVTARYEAGGATADPFARKGPLFSALAESYPQLTGLDVYDKVVDYIQAGRARFRNVQDELQDRIRVYNTWRQKGIVHEPMVKLVGFPSDRLYTTRGGQRVSGQAALEKMEELVLSKDTNEIFRTGEDQALTVPSGK